MIVYVYTIGTSVIGVYSSLKNAEDEYALFQRGEIIQTTVDRPA